MSEVCLIQTFRAIGLMGSAMSPEWLLTFYAKLGLIALDLEFAQPGCEGSPSDFVSVYELNMMLLVFAASPVFVLMPLLWGFGEMVEKEHNPGVSKYLKPWRLAIGMFPNTLTTEWGSEFRLKWKERFVFAATTWYRNPPLPHSCVHLHLIVAKTQNRVPEGVG